MGSLRASQLLLSSGSLLCKESLGESELSQDATNHSSIPKDAIISDSQLAEDERLWRNRRFGASPMSMKEPMQLIVASSVNEEFCSEKEERKREEAFATPESKKREIKKEEEKESNSRLGTPFRVGLKASVVASSIFDSPLGKKEESPRRLGRGKKAMIQSKNIMNYFSPKKSGKHNDLENTRYRVWLQQTDHTYSSIWTSDCRRIS